MSSSLSDFSIASGLSEPLLISYTHRITGISGTEKVSEPFVFFGRHPLNSVLLDDPSVSRKHAYLQVIDHRLFIVDLGSRRGVRIAGEIRTQSWLDVEQVVEIGDFDIRISGLIKSSADRPPPTTPSTGTDFLRIAISTGNDSKGLILYPVQSPVTLIGRNTQCNFCLFDERLLQFHASIILTPTGIWLVDLLGNGATQLNDRIIRTSLVQSGDRICLNGVTLEVQMNHPKTIRSQTPSKLEVVSNRMDRYSLSSGETPSLVDEVSDLRKATLLLASLFAEMKREQTQLMQRQFELMEIMTAAFRESRSNIGLSAIPASQSNSDSHAVHPQQKSPALQFPRTAKPGEEEALRQAHSWFLSRLQNIDKPQS